MCFTIGWVLSLCAWLIVVIATVAIIRILVPYLTGLIGIPIVAQIINIILWAVVALMALNIIGTLISCLLGSGGGWMHFPR